MAFWHPCHTLACLALGAPFGQRQQQMPHSFRANHRPLGAANKPLCGHASCPKWAKKRQNANCGKKVLTSRPKSKGFVNSTKWGGKQLGVLVGMPQQGLGGRGQCSQPGGLPRGCHLDSCVFLGWTAFHGNFPLWAASMPPCQCACPRSCVRPKVCSLGW